MIAGVNVVEGVHDTLYNLMCYLYIGVINRIIAVVQILLIYGIFRWSFTICGARNIPLTKRVSAPMSICNTTVSLV